MKKILKRATACLLAVLMLAGEATVQVAAIDSNGNGTTKTVSYVATHNYTVYYLDLKGMCYIMRDKGIDVGVSYVSNASNVTFRWQAYNLDKHKWSLVADWTGSNWVTWKQLLAVCRGNDSGWCDTEYNYVFRITERLFPSLIKPQWNVL